MPPEDGSTSSPQGSTPSTPEPAPEPPAPAAEAPAPTPEPSASPVAAPEANPTSEVTPPEAPTGPQGPLPLSKTDDRQESQVAHIPPSEPFDSAQDKPTPEPPPSRDATAGRSEPIKPPPEPPSSAANTPTSVHPIRDLLNKARVAIQDRKRKKRDKIMQALNTRGKITNDEVEKLLHVSDATATRYLSALEKEGRIRQVGKTGHGVVYQKI